MKLLLVTFHARYIHASLALPALAAACRDIDGLETVIRERSATAGAPMGLKFAETFKHIRLR